eukprot:TRINITY_DN3383_c0_g1_i1.p1 TRINITY_DN3383_c0_g1~~TRINITY_DN3383_c0_g1_i1.p1  ORF type:complete len:421 (-),score=35.57 TRINITY_DN3383_c0_g1_i1:76-1338(-)
MSSKQLLFGVSRSMLRANRTFGARAFSNSSKGFASMPREKVQEIAAEGGRSSHGGRSRDDSYERLPEEDRDFGSHGRQGFASMPREQVRDIASKGGRSSHRGESNGAELHGYESRGRRDHGFDREDAGRQERRASYRDDYQENEEQGRQNLDRSRGADDLGQDPHFSNPSDKDPHGGESRSEFLRAREKVLDHLEEFHQHHQSGARGFASMPHEQVQEIARMGGKASHKGSRLHDQSSFIDGGIRQAHRGEPLPDYDHYRGSDMGRSNRGLGGRNSHKNDYVREDRDEYRAQDRRDDYDDRRGNLRGRDWEDRDEQYSRGQFANGRSRYADDGYYRESDRRDEERDLGRGRQGFAAMPREVVQEIGASRWQFTCRFNFFQRVDATRTRTTISVVIEMISDIIPEVNRMSEVHYLLRLRFQ